MDRQSISLFTCSAQHAGCQERITVKRLLEKEREGFLWQKKGPLR